jgi:acetoin utilization deacetylase AcuC-like enzyme
MSHLLKQFKKTIFVVLEGGYNIDTLKWGVEAVVEGLDKNYKPKEVIEPKF